MRKYMEISRMYLKEQLVWRTDVIINMLLTVTKILFALLLWGIIFEGRTEVSGFTFQAMLSYYIVSSFFSQLDQSTNISWEVSSGIRNGTFSKYMIMPVKLERYFTAKEIGVVSFYFIFDLIAALIWILLFHIDFTITTNWTQLLGAVVMEGLGLYFLTQVSYYLGILTLKYEDVGTFLMIKNNIMSLITGSIIPLALFPEQVITVMRFLPFYYITYLPSMLIIGKNGQECMIGLFVMLVWCIAIKLIIKLTWHSYRRKYDGCGI